MTDSTHPMLRRLDPRGHVHFRVRPRHLAGTGDPRHVTHALTAAGWNTVSDPGYPHVALLSPDERFSLVFSHDSPAHGVRPDHTPRWYFHAEREAGPRAAYEPPPFRAEADGPVPVEFIAGFADALALPAPAKPQEVRRPLLDAGWTVERGKIGIDHMFAPDPRLVLHRLPASAGTSAWRAEVKLDPGDDIGGPTTLWSVYISAGMPEHAIVAFAAALAENGPVQRRSGDLPQPRLVTAKHTGPQGEALAHIHARRVAYMCNTVRAARSTSDEHGPPKPPPTTPGHHR